MEPCPILARRRGRIGLTICAPRSSEAPVLLGGSATWALDLIAAGKKIAEIARDLGVSDQTIYNWRTQDRIDRGLEPGLSSTELEELARARRRIAELETELAAVKRSQELLRETVPPKGRFDVIAQMADEGHPIKVACRILGVSESGFYAWRARPPSTRAIRHAWLTDLITQVHLESRGTYGALRVHAELTLGLGVVVGHNGVAMLMHRAGVQGRSGTRRRKLVRQVPTAADLVDRQFSRDAPDELVSVPRSGGN